MWFTTHYGENVQTRFMNCDVGMVTFGRRVPKIFLQSFFQRSLQTSQCIPHHIPLCHTITCRLFYCFVWLHPWLWSPLGDFLWCCLLWSTLGKFTLLKAPKCALPLLTTSLGSTNSPCSRCKGIYTLYLTEILWWLSHER